jgi:hypothetical protein
MGSKKTLLISGASIAAGAGLVDERFDSQLWANQISKEYNLIPTNIAQIGDDNREIFFNTMLELCRNQYDYAIIQWVPIPNINIRYGLELYPTRFNLIGTREFGAINLVADQKIDINSIKRSRDYQMKFYKEHWEIRELVAYCKFIKDKMAKNTVYFLNFAMPWDQNHYFDKINWTTPCELDKFTQELLDVELRSDEDIKKLYNMIHQDYATWGPIDENDWLNLYDPLQLLQVDQVSKSDLHPGYLSQDRFSEFLINCFKKKL